VPADKRAWEEIALNQENIKRSEMAERWKKFAFSCICEGISVYLLGTKAYPGQGTPENI
jgi:hypothetical protein